MTLRKNLTLNWSILRKENSIAVNEGTMMNVVVDDCCLMMTETDWMCVIRRSFCFVIHHCSCSMLDTGCWTSSTRKRRVVKLWNQTEVFRVQARVP